MSYSRWITSEFYTYWRSPKTEKKEDNVFICHFSIGDNAGDTPDYCEWTWAEVMDILNGVTVLDWLSEQEMSELSLYMERFVNDVNDEFGESQPIWIGKKQKT